MAPKPKFNPAEFPLLSKLAESWEGPKAGPDALAVAQDAIEESGVAKYFGKTPESDRELRMTVFEGDGTPQTGDPRNAGSRPNSPDFRRARLTANTSVGVANVIKKNARRESGPPRSTFSVEESGSWDALMDDPAYPMLGAMLAGGAVLGAGSAQAAEPKKNQPVRLNLRPAQPPKVSWDGITERILKKDDEIKGIQATKQELGLSPDVFPEDPGPHFNAVVADFVKNQQATEADQQSWTAGLPGVNFTKKLFRDASLGEKHVLDPTLKAGFENFMVGSGAKGAAVPILRAAGQMVAGKEQLESRVHDPEMVKGINQMEDAIGSANTTVVLSAADLIGQAPLMIIGGGRSIWEAMGNGAMQALATPDQTMGEGAALGAVFHIGASAIGKLYGGVKSLLQKDLPDLAPVIKSKGQMFADKVRGMTEAEILRKNPKMAAEMENRLVGVVTKDGFKQIDGDIARALPDVDKVRKLGPGAQRMRSVAAFDADGRPVLKHLYWDPTNVSPARVETEALTVASAAAAKAKLPDGVSMEPAFQRRWALGENEAEGNALLRLTRLPSAEGPAAGRYAVTPQHIASSADYNGTMFEPRGGEVRIQQGTPKITPIFGDQRLPDELPPPVDLGEPTMLGEPDFGRGLTGSKTAPSPMGPNGTAVVQRDLDKTGVLPYPAINTWNPARGQTEMIDRGDLQKVGRPDLWVGGGAGKKPPPVAPDAEYVDPPAGPKPLFQQKPKTFAESPNDPHIDEPQSPVRQEPKAIGVQADKYPDAPKKPKPIFKDDRWKDVDDINDADQFIRIKGPPVPEQTITPQGAPSPLNVTPETVAQLSGVIKSYRTLQADPSGVDKALSLIAGRHLRGPIDLATTVTSIQASNQMAKMADDIRTALDVHFKGGLLSQANLDLHLYMEGKLTDAEFFAKHPQLTREAQELSRNLFDEKQYWDKWFQERGVVNAELGDARDQGIVPLYVTRRFWSRVLPPKVWAKKSMAPARADVMEKGINRILQDMLKSSPKVPYSVTKGNVRTQTYLPTVTEDEVALEVSRIMNAEDPVAAFQSANIGKPYSALMAKNRDLPVEIRDMLGEIRSGTVSTAFTIGMQRANAARFQLMEEVANSALTSDRPDIARGLTYQLPVNGAMFNAAGKYTSQAIFEALGNGPKITESSHRLLMWMQKMVKGHQVVGGLVGPHLNSLMDNLKGGVLAGGLDLTRIHKGAPDMFRAARALLHYKKDPSGKSGLGGLVLDAKRNGADYFGFGHEEINNPASLKFMKDLNAAFPDPKGNILSQAGTLLMRSMKGYERGLAWLGGGLDWVDRLFRLQSYIHNQDRYLADLFKNGTNSYLHKAGLVDASRPGIQGAAQEVRTMKFNPATLQELNSPQRLVHEMAGRLSARRVNQSFWNPTFVGKGVESIRKTGVGIITPYATALFEGWRVNGQVLHRLRSGEEPDLKWRLLQSIVVLGGAAGVMKAMSGVTDDEIQMAEAEQPDSRKTYRPATFAIAWHDDKGRVQFWNYTSWTELTRLMQGDPADPIANRVITNLLMSPVQGGLAERPVRKLFEYAGAVSPIGTPDKPVGVSETGAMALLQYLHSAGAFPGAFQQMANAARRTDIGSDGSPAFLGPTVGEYIPPLGEMIGQPKPYEEVLTPAEGALKAIGVSNLEPTTSGPTDYTGRQNPSRLAADIEANAEIGKKGTLVKEVKKIFRGQKGQASKEADAAEVKAEMDKRAADYRAKVAKRKQGK